MARVLNPLMSVDASGSVGGVQFSRNRYGNFGSRKSTSTRAQGDRVLAYRASIGAAHHAFDALTHADKATWDLTPTDRPKPREHFLKLYLARAARGLSQYTAYPGHSGAFTIIFLEIERAPPPLGLLYCGWLHDVGEAGWLDFVVRSTYLHAYDGHPRKFHWASSNFTLDETAIVTPGPYGRYLTLHVSAVDLFTLRPYHRWIYHWDGPDLISVTPPPP